jgi:WNT inhibitory factor 1
MNGGRCSGVNKCSCKYGFKGDNCEIGRKVNKRSK